jgi:hypothetical protein
VYVHVVFGGCMPDTGFERSTKTVDTGLRLADNSCSLQYMDTLVEVYKGIDYNKAVFAA